MAGGVRGAKETPKKEEYVHQEYPKVLFADDNSQILIKDAAHEQRHLAKTKKTWAESPSDFYDKETDPRHPEYDADAPDETGEGEIAPEETTAQQAVEQAARRGARAVSEKKKAEAAK